VSKNSRRKLPKSGAPRLALDDDLKVGISLVRRAPARALLVVAVLAALLAGSAGERALSDDAPLCERFAAQSLARERAVTGAGAQVAVVGDSYSAGLGLARPARSWPSRLDGRVHVFGFSGSGFSARASSCPAVSYADRVGRALRGDADLVVVQGGLNDFDQPVAAVRAGVRRLLAAVGERDVVLVGPPAAPARAERAARVDAVLADEAERAGVPYVTTYHLDLDYLRDGLHLTREGHRDFGDAVAAALADLSR
jgi:acyl-CoA thioesterase-1